MSTYPGECCRTPIGITPVLAAQAGVVQISHGGDRPKGAGLDHHRASIVIIVATAINTIVNQNLHLRIE